MYGALTDTIRKLLLDHKMLTTVTKRREAYTEFLRRLWGDEASKDVVFSVHGEEVRGHRFLLSTRCPQLRTMFEVILATKSFLCSLSNTQERWKGRNIVTLGNRHVTSHAFKLLLEYIYTGQVTQRISFSKR